VFDSGRVLPSTPVIILAAVSVPLLATGAVLYQRIRRRPKDKEKHRRFTVNLHGRLGDATITEVADNALFYTYSVGGVIYAASQDISQLSEYIPCNPELLAGGIASLKYSPQNPANSIILCEQWSGLRIGQSPPYARKTSMKAL
jgi:hypothetical protein